MKSKTHKTFQKSSEDPFLKIGFKHTMIIQRRGCIQSENAKLPILTKADILCSIIIFECRTGALIKHQQSTQTK